MRVPCTVRFTDRQNKQHSVAVEAGTMYEAACRAWSKFKLNDETFEESYKTEEFMVEAAGKTHRVNLEKMLAYMDVGRKGRNDTPHKKRLRGLNDVFLRIKHGEEKPDAAEMSYSCVRESRFAVRNRN
jgi:hypothetical protein